MARAVFTLEEILAMLETIGAAKGTIENFRKQAVFVADRKFVRAVDDVQVASGYGQKSRRGTVDLIVNDQLTQMDAAKAREIGLMLLEASEAAQSDEMFVALLERIGVAEIERIGQILLELREIRQGTRGTARPQ